MMMKKRIFNFDHSYSTLPSKFYARVRPSLVGHPEAFLINLELIRELDIDIANREEELTRILSGNTIEPNSYPIAQAYAGHQFGHFTMLGDGRAITLGEHIASDNRRYDIQLKGSGQTPYSRNGDGKATLKAMLREYFMSEAMHHLNISTSRSLAVIKTGEAVYRENIQEGAVLTRVMKSHIRVGTFEFASFFGTREDLQQLTDYTINRHFPEHKTSEQPALRLLEEVISAQIKLVAQWMRVGFIHGVMNTDNTSVSGETFDYGPCAFMNAYHPETVFSSIDANGRYAFGNQHRIIKWNLSRFAEALLPIIHEEKETSVKLAQQAIDAFDGLWDRTYYRVMFNKLGIEHEKNGDRSLLDELLVWMRSTHADYTNTFSALSSGNDSDNNPLVKPIPGLWLKKWRKRVSGNSNGLQTALSIMKKTNPVFIPRNHLVEEALEKAVSADVSLFNQLLDMLKTPYSYQKHYHSYLSPPDSAFEKNYQTFCGT
jgi:serine/tyrosine/threonine adenylyltransferase